MFNKIILAILLSVFTGSVNGQKLTVKWEKEFAVKDNHSVLPQNMVYGNGSLNVLGVSYENKTYKEGKFWHWKIDVDGKKKSAVDIATASADKRSALSWTTKGIAVNNGKVVVAGKFSSGSNLVLTSDGASSKSVSKNKISSDAKGDDWNHIDKMMQMSNGDIIFLGNNSKSDAVVALYSVEGEKIWYKSYKEGERSIFVDVVELDGNLYVAGVYGTGDNIYENYNTLLYKCDSEGNMITKIVLDGGGLYVNKQPQLAIYDGNIMLCYDKNPVMNRPEVMILRFNEKLEKLHEFCAYTTDKRVISLNKFAVLPSKGIVFAYTVNLLSINVNLFSISGETLSSVTLPDYAVLDGLNLTCSDNMVFVAASSMPLEVSYEMNAKICALEITE